MLDKIKDNLDNNPDKGVMGNITKTMSSMAKTRQNLSKGNSINKMFFVLSWKFYRRCHVGW